MARNKQTQNTPIPLEQQPFRLPENWQWVRLGEIVSILNGDRGKNYPAKSTLSRTGIPFISALNLNGITIVEDENLLCLSEEQYKKLGNGKLQKDDIVLCIRGSLGKHAKYPFEKGAIASSLVILRSLTNEPVISEYIMKYLDTPLFSNEIKKYDNGTAQPNLAAKDLALFLVPLPPLAEQKRIVEKIEQLFTQLDQAAEKLTAVIDGFELRKTAILHKACTGKLVPQNLTDEPAQTLLQRIQQEKQTCLSSLKKQKQYAPIKQNEIPFSLPENWAWVRLGEISYNVGNKNNQIFTKEIKKVGKFPVISQGQSFIDGYSDEVDKVIYDLPLVMFGDHTKNVKFVDFPFIIGADGTKFHKIIGACPKYIYFWMLLTASLLQNRGYARHYSLLTKTPIPLPPLSEQHHIVEKIEQLLEPSIQAKQQAEDALQKIALIKKAILAQAFRGEL